ncbi:hypothetical protein L9W92_18330 [Pelotomaculum terephthalicicum JT]|uniref:hypothetical protein n=1 Tax=Pelotomaculum terephthalicicum TaxID=206393 RepID=UPI001F04E351|nr:hypothetical protein [Pelotomaculum terephthalicicum]MCG9969954.1 hypothetical protein [Pelotomaculum terephthalicicum JT]
MSWKPNCFGRGNPQQGKCRRPGELLGTEPGRHDPRSPNAWVPASQHFSRVTALIRVVRVVLLVG